MATTVNAAMVPADTPQVSVVMSVYNGADTLEASMESVLSQKGVEFEFVVVNDGSTDATGSMLDAYAARDKRLHVIHQANSGLTRALIRGCAAVRGEFIARQDCGDTSLPGRLAAQHALLKRDSGVVLTCVSNRVVGPNGEFLFEVVRAGRALSDGLAQLDVSKLKGPPHHGSTMFARAAYERVGGYRPSWVVAQDIDLWLRLAEVGDCVGLDVIGYQSQLELAGISSRRREEQLRLCGLAIECAVQRRRGESDANIIKGYVAPPIQPKQGVDSSEQARFFYFVGACLRETDPVRAKLYFIKALRLNPLHWRAMLRAVGW